MSSFSMFFVLHNCGYIGCLENIQTHVSFDIKLKMLLHVTATQILNRQMELNSSYEPLSIFSAVPFDVGVAKHLSNCNPVT